MKLRIWHNSNLGNPAFTRDVPDIETAILLLDVLAYYDLYQGDRVVANAQGLQYYDEQEKEWFDWCNEEGEDIDEVREKASEEANKIVENLASEEGESVEGKS